MTSLSLFTFMHWRRKWQPTPVFLPGESQGRGGPGGLPSMGSHRLKLLSSSSSSMHVFRWQIPQRKKEESEVAQLCPTLSDAMDCSPLGSSVHGIFQARVLEWVAIAFSQIHAWESLSPILAQLNLKAQDWRMLPPRARIKEFFIDSWPFFPLVTEQIFIESLPKPLALH